MDIFPEYEKYLNTKTATKRTKDGEKTAVTYSPNYKNLLPHYLITETTSRQEAINKLQRQINQEERCKAEEKKRAALMAQLDRENAKAGRQITVTWKLLVDGKDVEHTETIPASIYHKRLKEHGKKEHESEFIERYNFALQLI